MSTSFADFISNWNDSMPVQIRDSDIRNPTEHIFRRLLIAMLKTLFVDTSGYENMDFEGGNILRASRVKLISTTNYFFKIANPDPKKRHDLVYMDLIQPSFKKVFNTLNYLMNYSVYVNHRYKETVLDLNEQLKERDDLRTRKNQLRKTLEEAKIKEENNRKEIRALDVKIPRQKAQIEDLEAEQMSLKNKISKLKEDSEITDMNLAELRNDIEDLKSSTMSNEEIEAILEAKQNVLQHLEEQNHITAALRQKLKENSQAIEEVQTVTRKMEALTVAFDIDPEKLKSMKQQVEKTEANILKLKMDITRHRAEVTSMSQALAAKNNELELNVKKLDEAKKSFSAKETEQMKELKETQCLLRELTAQEAALAATYNRLRREQQLMFQTASNVIKHISTKMMDDEDTENCE